MRSALSQLSVGLTLATIATLNTLLPSTASARLGETLAEAVTRYGSDNAPCYEKTSDTPLMVRYGCGCPVPDHCAAFAEVWIERESGKIVRLRLTSMVKVDAAFLEDIIQKNSQGLSWTITRRAETLEFPGVDGIRSDGATATGNSVTKRGGDGKPEWWLLITHPRYEELSRKKGQF